MLLCENYLKKQTTNTPNFFSQYSCLDLLFQPTTHPRKSALLSDFQAHSLPGRGCFGLTMVTRCGVWVFTCRCCWCLFCFFLKKLSIQRWPQASISGHRPQSERVIKCVCSVNWSLKWGKCKWKLVWPHLQHDTFYWSLWLKCILSFLREVIGKG